MNQPINETPVQIIINGRAAMTIMTSAEDPTDLVVGQLYTERAIETYADISSMHTDGPQTSVVRQVLLPQTPLKFFSHAKPSLQDAEEQPRSLIQADLETLLQTLQSQQHRYDHLLHVSRKPVGTAVPYSPKMGDTLLQQPISPPRMWQTRL